MNSDMGILIIYRHITITVEIVSFCPTKCTGKEAKKMYLTTNCTMELVHTLINNNDTYMYYEYYIWNLQNLISYREANLGGKITRSKTH